MTPFRKAMVVLGLAAFVLLQPLSGVTTSGLFGADEALGKPKVKVLAAVTGSTSGPNEIFPWGSTLDTFYHKPLYELRGDGDYVRIVTKVTGPDGYEKKYVSDWLGPHNPGVLLHGWLSEQYDTPGLYKLNITVKPQSNKKRGASSQSSRFRVMAP